MKKLLLVLLVLFSTLSFSQSTTFAQATGEENPSSFTRTILPEVNKSSFPSNSACRLLNTTFEKLYFDTSLNTDKELGSISRFDATIQDIKEMDSGNSFGINLAQTSRNDVLGCSIITGRIKSFYLSIFIAYSLNMLAILAGSISMLFIMLGGYKYVIGSLTQSTDDAKKTIFNAIIGLAVSTGAWILVNIVLAIISS